MSIAHNMVNTFSFRRLSLTTRIMTRMWSSSVSVPVHVRGTYTRTERYVVDKMTTPPTRKSALRSPTRMTQICR